MRSVSHRQIEKTPEKETFPFQSIAKSLAKNMTHIYVTCEPRCPLCTSFHLPSTHHLVSRSGIEEIVWKPKPSAARLLHCFPSHQCLQRKNIWINHLQSITLLSCLHLSGTGKVMNISLKLLSLIAHPSRIQYQMDTHNIYF